jgi:hypothetical protein
MPLPNAAAAPVVARSKLAIIAFSCRDTKPWANKQGWELTATQSCQQLLAAPARAPSYCSWNGISCCDPAGLAGQQCSHIHSVSELKVQVNGLNGTLGSPGIIHNLLQLHACGMTKLNLQGNDLSGSMTAEWGRMTNLTVLDLCEHHPAAAAAAAAAQSQLHAFDSSGL